MQQRGDTRLCILGRQHALILIEPGSAVNPVPIPDRIERIEIRNVGFVAKYILDKRWVFFDAYESHASEARKVMIYGAFGVGTTLLFWGIELAAWHLGVRPRPNISGPSWA